MMIEIKNLTVTYPAQPAPYTALDSVDLTVPTGGTCAVIGPSGCGKSTLLKVLAGIVTQYEGTASIGGCPVSPSRQRIGFIPQNYGLLPWKTVDDNILLGVRIKDRGARADGEALRLILRRLGIDGLGRRYPGELSGGQQQRVSLARAFLLCPDVLLMDEPFSALDAMTREEMQEVFLTVWKEHAVSTVLVTHYVEEAVYLGQKIAVLSAQGKIKKVLENPLFGADALRGRKEFFELGLELRNLIKKDEET